MKVRHSKFMALLVITLLITAMLTGCGPKAGQTTAGDNTSGDAASAPQKQGLVYPISAEIPSLDPQLANAIPSFNIGKHVFEGLIRVHNGKIQPGMAESWDTSPDGITYTFHLRDAQWSDGSKVTAKDFEFGLLRLLDPNTAASYAFAGLNIKNGGKFNSGEITDPTQVGIKALDEKTLEIKLEYPTKYFLSYLDLMCFYPTQKAAFDKYGTTFATEADKMLYNGPFILKEWKHEQEMVLEKNPNYWDKDSIKLNSIKAIQVNDINTAISMYENGELDFCDIPMPLVEQYKKEDKALVYMSGADDWMQINLKAKGKPWLANKNFRQALSFAINREDYVLTTTKGLYKPATRLVLPIVSGSSGYYCDEHPLSPYTTKADPAKAKELLQAAMKELNITDPAKISVTFLTQDEETSKLMAESLQDQITKNLGITFDIQVVPYKQKIERMNKSDYEMLYAGWGPDYDDPMTYMELWETKNSQNTGKYSNPKYDRLIEGARVETDAKKRCEMFYEAEKILLDDAPLVPLQYRQRAWTCNPALKGVVRHFIGADTDMVYAYFEGAK